MTTSGSAAKNLLAARLNAQQAGEAKAIDEAKRAARQSGKEPFDAQKLATLTDLGGALGTAPDAAALARIERDYWLRFPEVKTLADFARRRAQLDSEEAS